MSLFFFSSRRRHTRSDRDWSSDVCSSDPELQSQAEDGIRDLIVTGVQDRKSTRLNSSHDQISYAVFCLRSEEHTSELQSRSDLVCRLLLEKKKYTVCTSRLLYNKIRNCGS